MNICIAGASGFIGKSLFNCFVEKGHQLTVINREDFLNQTIGKKVKNQDVIINLVGRTIQGRWSKRTRNEIYDSRINTTRMLAEEINYEGKGLRLFINVSAVGIYDSVHIHDENSTHLEKNFLATVVREWEVQVEAITDPAIRKVVLRLGVVLGRQGGFFYVLNRFLRFKIGVGIEVSEGFPFIHIDDLKNAVDFIMLNESVEGIVNVVSPDLISIAEFFEEVNSRSGTWMVFHLKAALLQFLLGESSALLTRGQYVVPGKLLGAGFTFCHPTIRDAVKDLVNS